jgi:hypothetical protein
MNGRDTAALIVFVLLLAGVGLVLTEGVWFR